MAVEQIWGRRDGAERCSFWGGMVLGEMVDFFWTNSRSSVVCFGGFLVVWMLSWVILLVLSL